MAAKNTTPVSPKVVTAGVTAAAATLVMYVLSQWAFVAQMPEAVQGALLVLVTGGVTYIASYLKGDPLRGYFGQHRADDPGA